LGVVLASTDIPIIAGTARKENMTKVPFKIVLDILPMSMKEDMIFMTAFFNIIILSTPLIKII